MHNINYEKLSLILLILQVTKDQVDTFEPGKLVPRCQLRLDWVGNAQPTDLCYQVPLNGAKEPFTFITIESDINALQQPSPQSVTMESNQGLHLEALPLSITCHKSSLQ